MAVKRKRVCWSAAAVAALSATHLQPSEADTVQPAPDVSVPDVLPLDTPAQPTAIMQAESTIDDEIELPATLPRMSTRNSVTIKAAGPRSGARGTRRPRTLGVPVGTARTRRWRRVPFSSRPA